MRGSSVVCVIDHVGHDEPMRRHGDASLRSEPALQDAAHVVGREVPLANLRKGPRERALS